MPAAKQVDREKVSREFVDVAFDDAYAIREEYNGETGLLARRRENRNLLRSLATQGYLSEEQREELEELYPARERASQEEEEAQVAGGAE